MSASRHRLTRASAGTGKTHALTTRYLELLFEGVDPERCLGTTFTRKAAGEIQGRVLERLHDAATREKELARLQEDLGRASLSAADCRRRLAALVRDADRMRVDTLDAFFVQVAHVLALDLGLAPGWGILDDVDERPLVEDAIAHALDRARPLEWALLLTDLQGAPASRPVHEELVRIARGGLEVHAESRDAAWETVSVPPGLSETELADALAWLERLALPLTKAGEEHSGWRKGRDDAVADASAGRWDGLLESGLVKRAVGGAPDYYLVAIGAELRTCLSTLAAHAVHALVRQLVAANRATRELLGHVAIERRLLEDRSRAYGFGDVARVLAGSAGGAPALAREDVWHRLDAGIDHLLLDEFQDTSSVQWRAIAPLVESILADRSGARSLFCVGDAKQSIYGWRSGEPRLLALLAEQHPELERQELAVSYRSSRVVLETVERVFAEIAASPALARSEPQRVAAAEWQRSFRAIEPARDLAGEVRLLEAPPAADDDDAAGPALELGVQTVLDVLRQASWASVAILLRRNRDISRLIHRLRRAGIRASGEGGNPLTDSAAVLQALSLFHLADHPGDRAAAFHVASSPLGPAIGLELGASAEDVARVAARLRAQLVSDGYGTLCSELQIAVERDERTVDWDRRRFAQLVDQAHAFDARASLRPSDFVARIRVQRFEDPAASQVQVMTVHSAKGLEFDAVVLPELDQPLTREKDIGFVTDRPDPAGWIERVSRAPRKVLADRVAELAELREATLARGAREELCVLYVALTRARHRLDMIVRPSKEGAAAAATFAGVLRAALASGPAQEGVLWRHEGSSNAWCARKPDAELPQRDEVRLTSLGLAPSRRPRALATRTPSGEEGGGARRIEDILRPRRRSALARGKLIHRWLAEVEWLEGFDRSDEDLLALAEPIEPDRERRRAALDELRAMLGRPGIRAALSRPSVPRGVELRALRESAFANVLPEADGREALWTGAIDRVVQHVRKGRVEAAEIVDFKTDRIEPGELEQRIAFYRPQIEAYRRVVAHRTGLLPAVVTARILFLELDRAVEVAAL